MPNSSAVCRECNDSSRPCIPGRRLCSRCRERLRRERLGHAPQVAPTIPTSEPRTATQTAEPQVQSADLGQHLADNRRLSLENARLRQQREQLVTEVATLRSVGHIADGVRRGFEPLPVQAPPASERRVGVPVLLCSDWHVEEPVPLEKVNGLNEYSLEIADRRITRLTDGFVWMLHMLESRFDMPAALVWLGGDLMTGHIHEDLAETSELPPVETVIWLKQRIVRMLDAILADTDVPRLIVPCSFGNHGRTTAKARVLTAAEHSYEWLLYQLLAEHYADEERVEIVTSKSAFQYVDVLGHTLLFTHGDQITFGGGVGGLLVPLAKAVSNWNTGRAAEVSCIGHWHQYIPGRRAVVNGSLIGYSPYAMKVRAAYEPPQQAFFVVDSVHGACLHTPIWCD